MKWLVHLQASLKNNQIGTHNSSGWQVPNLQTILSLKVAEQVQLYRPLQCLDQLNSDSF